MRKSEINTTLLEKREYVLLKNRREELSLIPTDYILEYYPKKDDVPTLTLEIPNKVRRGDLVVDYPLYEQFQPRRHIVVKVEGQPVERYVVEDLEIDEEKDVKIKRITAYGYEHILKSKACLIGEGLTRQLYLTPDENVHVGEGILNIFEQQTGWKVNHIDELARKEQVTENISITKELMGNMTYPKVDDNTVLLEKDFTVPSEQGFPLNFDIAWVDLVVTTTDGFTYKPGSVVHTFTDFHQGIKKIKATFTSNSTQRYGITYVFILANDEVKTITYAFTNCRGLKLEVKQVNLTYQTSQEEEKLVTKYRYLEYGQSYWYEYLKTTVQEAYGVYIKFNSHDKTIDVYNEEQFGEWKGFYLDYNNLLTKVSKQPDMDELCTRLWIQSNNVDITEVNPMGTSYLEDYSYFEKSGTMSESLKNALKRYYVNIEAQQIKWEEISKLKKSTDQWLTKRNSELTSLNEQVKAKQALLTAYLKAGNNEAGQKRVAEELRQLEEQVSTKLREIETLKEQSDNYLSQMQLIGKQMAKETSVDSQGKIFSELDLEELGDITIEQTYTDDYHTKASGLYDYAQTLMKDKASLRYSFSLEHKDLAQNIKHPLGWEWFIELGAKVEIADKDIANKDGFITIYAFKYSPKNKKMESVEFNNNSVVIKAVAGLASFSKVTYNTANLTDFWKETWREAEGATALVSDIRKNGLDLAANIVRGGNTVNKISMTESGLFVIDSNNENNQIYVGSSLIAITDDRWITSKTAIDQGGLIADTIVGRLILGESLFLSNEDGSFSITSQGLSIKDNTQKEIIGLGVNTDNNTNHFHIGNKNDSAYLIFDENGNLDIKATSVKLSTGDIVDKNEIKDYISNSLGGILLGTRNLALKTDIDKHGVGMWTRNGGDSAIEVVSSPSYLDGKTIKITGNNGMYYNGWIKLERNATYTYSMMMISDTDMTFTKESPLHMWVNSSQSVGHLENIESFTTSLPANTWQQVYITFKTPDTEDIYYMRPYVYDIKNATVNVCRIQVEKGNKPSDWTVAPEDVGFDIATSKQEAIDEANKTLTTTISNYYTKAETESHIELSKEKIELGVSQKYETIENVKTQVTSTLNSAQSYADDKKDEAIDSANATLSSTIANYYTKKETESAIKLERESIELGVSTTYETISNVTSQVSSALNDAKTYAEDKKNEAITSANNTLTTTISNYYTKKDTDSRIELAKEEINLSVKTNYHTKTEVDNKIEGIQIGGRNLVKKKSNFKYGYISVDDGSEQDTGDKLNANQDFFTVEYFSLKQGETICITSYPKENVSSNIDATVYIHVYSTSKTWQKALTGDGGGSNKVANITYTTTEDCYIRFSAHGFNDYNHMAEYATKASDWTPAPEDTEVLVTNTKSEANEYTDSKIQIAKGEITQTVASTYETKSEVTNKINGVNSTVTILENRVSKAEQKITDSAIIQTVSQTINNAKTEAINSANSNTANQLQNYSTTLQMNSAIQQKTDSITSEVSKIERTLAIDNLLANGNFTNGINNWEYKDFGSPINYTISANTDWVMKGKNALLLTATNHPQGVDSGFTQTIDVKPNTDYTFTGYVASHRAEGLVIIKDNQGTWLAHSKTNPDSDKYPGTNDISKWKRVRIVYNSGNRPKLHLHLALAKSNDNGHVWFHDFMVHEGNMDLCWKPSERETRAKVEILDNRITSTVSSISAVNGKVDKAQSQITQQANQIASKVNTSDFSSLIQQNGHSVMASINNSRGSMGVGIDMNGLYGYNNGIATFRLTEGKFHAYNSTNGQHMGYFGTIGGDLRANLFGANTFSVYSDDRALLFRARYIRDANYGNATLDMCGGINFVHRPGQNTGLNQILLGNHDVNNQYGMHNMSIRCWNSLGFQDNAGLTHMFFKVRTGDIVMKGKVYQSAQTPPRSFSMNFDEDDEVYRSGFTRKQAVESIMKLKTGVHVDNDGECCTALYGGHDELITTEYTDEDGITSTHINTSALNASLVVTCQEQQKLIEELQEQNNTLQQELAEIKRMLVQVLK